MYGANGGRHASPTRSSEPRVSLWTDLATAGDKQSIAMNDCSAVGYNTLQNYRDEFAAEVRTWHRCELGNLQQNERMVIIKHCKRTGGPVKITI